MNRQRIDAFKDAMLNTCVRAVREAFSGLTLSNCLESEDFRAAAYFALTQPLLAVPVEMAMATARQELLEQIEGAR